MYPYLFSPVLVMLILLTLIGNSLVILSICFYQRMRTFPNILLMSLACSDLLVGLVIAPLALLDLVHYHSWPFGSLLCVVWSTLDVLLCTASILNLCIINLDRYFAITYPFRYTRSRNNAIAAMFIGGVWLLSTLICIPPWFVPGWKAQILSSSTSAGGFEDSTTNNNNNNNETSVSSATMMNYDSQDSTRIPNASLTGTPITNRISLENSNNQVLSSILTDNNKRGFSDNEQTLMCGYTKAVSYRLYSAMGSFFIPLVIIILVYLKIFRVATSREKLLAKDCSKNARPSTSNSPAGAGAAGGTAAAGGACSSAGEPSSFRICYSTTNSSFINNNNSNNNNNNNSTSSRMNSMKGRVHRVRCPTASAVTMRSSRQQAVGEDRKKPATAGASADNNCTATPPSKLVLLRGHRSSLASPMLSNRASGITISSTTATAAATTTTTTTTIKSTVFKRGRFSLLRRQKSESSLTSSKQASAEVAAAKGKSTDQNQANLKKNNNLMQPQQPITIRIDDPTSINIPSTTSDAGGNNNKFSNGNNNESRGSIVSSSSTTTASVSVGGGGGGGLNRADGRQQLNNGRLDSTASSVIIVSDVTDSTALAGAGHRTRFLSTRPSLGRAGITDRYYNNGSERGSLAATEDEGSELIPVKNKRTSVQSFSTRHTKAHREKALFMRELKTVTTIGVVVSGFILCWLPFFILYLLESLLYTNGVGDDQSRDLPPEYGVLGDVFLWLGYSNSALNPLVYTFYNRDFRRCFRDLLQCGCRNRDGGTRGGPRRLSIHRLHQPPTFRL